MQDEILHSLSPDLDGVQVSLRVSKAPEGWRTAKTLRVVRERLDNACVLLVCGTITADFTALKSLYSRSQKL